jgi:nucleoside 2-deoxyribosyltransferase
MTESGADQYKPAAAKTYRIYSAGGLFNQDELATNILIKEAIWRLSLGKFQLFLPQSKELQILDDSNVEALIRNFDLLEIIKADIMLVRFEGVEPEPGTVLEYAVAKFLGKPTLLLRTDFRRVNFAGLSEPYNLMLKNWPRTVEVQLNSYEIWADIFSRECQKVDDCHSSDGILKAELGTTQKSLDEIASRVIAGLETVLEMESPYPLDLQEGVYQALRYSPGSNFDQMLSAVELSEIIQRLRDNGTF